MDSLYVNVKNATYFDSFGVSKWNLKIHRVQAYDLTMCGYFSIGFIDFILKGKGLLEYTNLVSPNDYEKNDNIMLKHFQ